MTNGITRRVALGAMAAPAIIGLTRSARADTRTLKISHQFPGSSGDTGDFRDRICRKFAEEVEKRSKGALKFEIYPNASLMKTFAQFDALKKGALDLSLYPTTYAGGEDARAEYHVHAGGRDELSSRATDGRKRRSARR